MFPNWLSFKESTCNTGDSGSIPGSGTSPGGGNGNPLQYFFLGNPMGQRSLVDYSPRGRKRADHDLVTKQQLPLTNGGTFYSLNHI